MIESFVLIFFSWLAIAIGVIASIGLTYISAKETDSFFGCGRKFLIGLLYGTCFIFTIILFFDFCKQTVFLSAMWLVISGFWVCDSLIDD